MKEKELKFLYETKVIKQIEEKVVEVKEDNGEKIEIVRTIKKGKPIKIAILKPTRRLFEGAEKFYAIQMAENIKSGLLPYSLVAKRYANDGGPLSEPEKNHLIRLQKELEDCQAKYFALAAEQNPDKVSEKTSLLIKINEINTDIEYVNNAYADIFENTAEVKSRNKTIEWWVFYLAYIDEDDKGYKPIFGEDFSYEARIEKYDEILENEEPFINECVKKISYLIAFWFASRSRLSNIDFNTMDELFDKNLSSYKIEDKEDTKIEEAKV